MGDDKQLEAIFRELRNAATIDMVNDFLKARELPFSAPNWNGLIDERIIPALDNGDITKGDLIGLLSSAEEHGKQHVFLYQAKKPSETWRSDQQLESWLRTQGAVGLLKSPKYLEAPLKLTMTRVESAELKGVPTHKLTFASSVEKEERSGETRDGATVTKRYKVVRVRTVNVVRLHRDGLLEIRIAAHSGSPQYYRDEVFRMFSAVDGLVQKSAFREVGIAEVGDYMWNNRTKLKSEIRFATSTARDDHGVVMKAACGRKNVDLTENGNAEAAMVTFRKDGATTDEAGVYFTSGPSDREVHARISGQENEFSFGRRIHIEEFEYVLARIRKYLES